MDVPLHMYVYVTVWIGMDVGGRYRNRGVLGYLQL